MATLPPEVDAFPTPAPQRGDRATFALRFDAVITWFATQIINVMQACTTAYNNAVAAATSADAAAAAADAATNAANAAQWVSGTTYAKGAVVWSPSDLQTYRRAVAGAGTADPSSDSTNWQIISRSAFPYMKVSDTKGLGVNGGSSISGYQDRVLNTVNSNGISGASLSGNSITLPAGTYEVIAFAQGYAVGSHQIRLMNATDSAVLVAGSSAFAPSGSGAAQTTAILEGRFVLSASKQLRLSHYTQLAQTSIGLGNALDANAVTAGLFAQVAIRKVV